MRKILFFLLLLYSCTLFSTEDSLAIWLKSYRLTNDVKIKLICLSKVTHQLRYTDCKECIKYCDSAEVLALEAGDSKSLINIYINKSISYKELAKDNFGLSYCLKAVGLAEDIKDSASIAASYLNLGAFHHSDSPRLAETYYLKALVIFQKLGNKRKEYKIFGNLSDIYNRTGRIGQAYECLEKSIVARKEEGDSKEIGVGYYLLAFNLSTNRLLHRSLSAVDTALTYLKNSGNEFYYYQSLILKGELLSKLSEYMASNSLLIPLFKNELVRKNIDLILAVCQNVSYNYEKLDNSLEALRYSRLEKQYSDSLYKLDNLRSLNEMQGKFETEKKEQEISLLNKEKELNRAEIDKQKFIKNTFIIGSIIALIFILFCLRIISLLRKSKKYILIQNQELESKSKDIMDSFHYAERIQKALLAGENVLNHHLPEYSILFKPKDIVSGDFYWAASLKNSHFALITADSTGHGVPGAFMSLLNISFLNESVSERNLTDPADILNHTRSLLVSSLAKDGSYEGGKDGMDCVLCVFDFENMSLTYAAANNTFYLVRNSQLLLFNGDKMPVGKSVKESVSFTTGQIDLQKGDLIFTLTDGYADQFGGPKGKKFMYKQLEELLLKNSSLPLANQIQILEAAFSHWRGKLEQVDDVLIIGVRV